MDNNLDKVALDLYGKIQSRFPDITIGNEHAEELSTKADIPKARFFEFEYTEDGEPLGTIAITLDVQDGIVVQVSGDLVDDDSTTRNHNAFKFIRSFRQFAKNRLLNFDIQNIGKSNLDKRDYQFQAKPKEQPMMESKMFGTPKISYQDLGEARLIVKHSQPINPEVAGGRTMHIQSIYIENIEGERFKYPFKHLQGARALAEHIKHGGIPYDAIGKHITGLSEELAQLRKFKGYVSRNDALAEAMGTIPSKVFERIDTIKKEIQSLQRGSYYEQFAESFEERDEVMIPEEIMTDWIDRLTVRTFNEDLKAAFPYLYNIVDESELPILELSADDLLDETAPKGWEGTVKGLKQHKEIDNPFALAHWMKNKGYKSHKKESLNPELALESFLESIINEDKDEIFSPNKDAQQVAIEKLNQILSKELHGGPEGVNAIDSLKGLIDDPEFIDSLRDIDPDLDVRPLIQQFVLKTDPSVANLLHYGEGQIGSEDKPPVANPAPEPMPASAPEPAPGGEMPPEMPPAPGGEMPPEMPPAPGGEMPLPGVMPPPPAPIAESTTAKMKAKFIKVKEAGATLDTPFAEGMTVRDAIRECGMNPMECGFGEEIEMQESGVDQMLKSIAGFWNSAKRNFTIGGTRVKTKIIKGFKDGDYSNATPEEVKKVLAMIGKMDPSSNSGVQQSQPVIMQPHNDERANSLSVMVAELQQTNESDTLSRIRRNAGI